MRISVITCLLRLGSVLKPRKITHDTVMRGMLFIQC